MFYKILIILVSLLFLVSCGEEEIMSEQGNDNNSPYVKLFRSLVNNKGTENESLWIIIQFSESIKTNHGSHYLLDSSLKRINTICSWSNENTEIWISSSNLVFETPYVIVLSNYQNKAGETMNVFTTNLLFEKAEKIISNHPAGHIVISEICLGKFSDDNTDDEFIELYNPTSIDIKLTNNDIRIYQASSTGDPMLLCNFSSTNHFLNNILPSALNIPAYGYYLIVNENASTLLLNMGDAIVKDSRMTLSKNKRLYITSSGTPSDPQNIIDFIGFGETDIHEGTSSAPNPEDGWSLQRKAYFSSTSTSMNEGGIDAYKGNSEDSNDNGKDFILMTIPNPQNSISSPEYWK